MKDEFIIYIEEDKLNFSKSFKARLSKQLQKQLELSLDSENIFKKHFFALFINAENLDIKQKDDYAYLKIEILSPDSMARLLTIGWRSDSIPDKLRIHSDLTENDEIQFFYFNDLPIEELKRYLVKKQKVKNISKTDFEFRINYENFPDLIMKIGTKQPLESENLIAINKFIEKNRKRHFPNSYVSDFVEGNVMFNFQVDCSGYKETDMGNVEKFFNKIAKQISKLELTQKIEYIIIE